MFPVPYKQIYTNSKEKKNGTQEVNFTGLFLSRAMFQTMTGRPNQSIHTTQGAVGTQDLCIQHPVRCGIPLPPAQFSLHFHFE